MNIINASHPLRVALGPARTCHHDVMRALWRVEHTGGAYVQVDDDALDGDIGLPWEEMAEKMIAAEAECYGRLECNASGVVTADGWKGWIRVHPC